MQLRRNAARWLASIGSDQWSDVSIDDTEFRRRVEQSIANGETWVATDDQDHVLATIAVDQHTNPGLWSDQERMDALFIHRMIRDREAPQGTGRRLLDHAAALARQAGKKWLRLDAWTTNTDLHRYYQSQGFRHVRTVREHHTRSAALFELPVSIEVNMQSTIRKPLPQIGGPDHGNPSPPEHWHQVDGLTVEAPYVHPKQGPLEVPADSPRLHLWHDGSGWLISTASPSSPYNSSAKRVLNWEDGPDLHTDRQYTIKHQADEHSCQLVLHELDTPTEDDRIPHQSGQDQT